MMQSAPQVTAPTPLTSDHEQLGSERSFGMDGLMPFLDMVRESNFADTRLRGLFHACIGRKITKPDGTLVSAGVTWRELSVLLKDAKFDKDLAAQVGADPDTLSPRDRQRFWYSVIALARPDSAEARAEADELAELVQPLGYVVGPAPTPGGKPPAQPEASDEPKKPAPGKPKKKGK